MAATAGPPAASAPPRAYHGKNPGGEGIFSTCLLSVREHRAVLMASTLLHRSGPLYWPDFLRHGEQFCVFQVATRYTRVEPGLAPFPGHRLQEWRRYGWVQLSVRRATRATVQRETTAVPAMHSRGRLWGWVTTVEFAACPASGTSDAAREHTLRPTSSSTDTTSVQSDFLPEGYSAT